MFDNKTEVLNKMFAKGWNEASVVLVSCAETKDVVCHNEEEIINNISSANSGMISVEPLYTHKNKPGYYAYNKCLRHKTDGSGYVAGLSKIEGWMSSSEASMLFTSENC